MSRKHYIEMARVIRHKVETTPSQDARDAMYDLTSSLASMFKRDNSNFDRSRFMTACGLTGGSE